ncbi:hypothetical protein BDV27DRAFT_132332 [Aspergillus caelatus]|uniref:Uncharacterized protein n=1 Tax=Aspergillus caelatus TaxID=61420 RepID=A0A5N6ZYA1_9EURO|nr:uncharacterized protein BDV27DRAFT_132332 [Aspergillus caelatus]KAE8361899.1 hypothetical protein BDV27DRAFT_132332 [Aspergillus caelatus]
MPRHSICLRRFGWNKRKHLMSISFMSLVPATTPPSPLSSPAVSRTELYTMWLNFRWRRNMDEAVRTRSPAPWPLSDQIQCTNLRTIQSFSQG